MPITKSAIKKQRVDKKRFSVNAPIKGQVKSTLKAARSKPTKESIGAFYTAVDRAVKKSLIPERTASRLKSRLVKLSKKKASI
ncbi:30S ribosomal protein S20 [Candidatus Woesebacteria bacterium]|nr:30S ribosomal protein S20 [Candidatus Woesebacteria bacterium]